MKCDFKTIMYFLKYPGGGNPGSGFYRGYNNTRNNKLVCMYLDEN